MRARKADGGRGGGVVRESDYCTPSQFHAPRPIQVSQNVLTMVHWPRQENIFGICYLLVEIHEQAWVVQKSTTTYYLTKHDATEYFPRTISRCTGDVFYTEPRNWKGGGGLSPPNFHSEVSTPPLTPSPCYFTHVHTFSLFLGGNSVETYDWIPTLFLCCHYSCGSGCRDTSWVTT